MSRYSMAIGEYNSQITIAKRELEKYRDDLREEQKKSIRNSEMKAKFDICDKAITLLTTVKDNLLQEVRSDIEKKTNTDFKKSVGDSIIDKIKICDDFQLQALDTDGENRYDSLSAGQKEMLAIAFMSSLRQESGFNSPILIDFLFGRISGKNRVILTEDLKKLAKDVQIIFFFIDAEFTPEVKRAMGNFLGPYIEIKKMPNEKRSEVTQK